MMEGNQSIKLKEGTNKLYSAFRVIYAKSFFIFLCIYFFVTVLSIYKDEGFFLKKIIHVGYMNLNSGMISLIVGTSGISESLLVQKILYLDTLFVGIVKSY